VGPQLYRAERHETLYLDNTCDRCPGKVAGDSLQADPMFHTFIIVW
jgi:hypothetical protein